MKRASTTMPIWNFEIPSGTTPVLALDLSSLSITVSPGAGGRVTVDADESLVVSSVGKWPRFLVTLRN